MPRPFLRVFGRLRADGRFELLRGWETTRLARRCASHPDYSVELLDRNGHKVAAGPIELRGGAWGRELRNTSSRRVVGHVVLHPDAASLSIRHHDCVVHTSALAAHSPRITALRCTVEGDRVVLNWSARHDRELTFSVAIAAEDRHAVTLVQDISRWEHVFRLDELPAGGACAFVLMATDGLRSATLSGDRLTLPAKPVDLRIVSPREGETLLPAQPFSLIAHVTDSWGHSGSGYALEWLINDDSVARGTLVALAPGLQPGRHAIKLRIAGGGMESIETHREVLVGEFSDDHRQWLAAQRMLDE